MENLKKLKTISSQYSILYVEDDKDIANNIITYLSKLFNEIVYAQNGEEGLELYESNSFDIVITDILMPKIDGIEMTRKIKEINPSQNIIIISAYAEIDNFLDSIKIGIDGYIIKPINYIDMNNTLYKTVSKIEAFKDNQIYKKRLEELLAQLNIDNTQLKQFTEVIDKVAIVSRTNEKGMITYVNDFFTTLTGFRGNELIGNKHSIIRHEDTPKSLYRNLWETIKNGKTWEGTIKNKTKENKAYFTHAIIIPLFDINEKIYEYISISFLTTNEEVEKREFKRKVMTNYMEFKKTNLNAIQRISSLENELSLVKSKYESFKNKMEKTDLKHKKALKQIEFYEKGMKEKDLQYTKILTMQKNNLQKISESHKFSLIRIEKQKKELEQLYEDHKLKANEIIKLNSELNEQHRIILDLRDTIKNIKKMN